MRPLRNAAPAAAIALLAVTVVLLAAGVVSFALYQAVPVPSSLGWPFTLAFTVGVLSFAISGTAIARARPGNRIAWLMLLLGVVGSITFVLERAGAYLEFVRTDPIGNVLLAVTSPMVVVNTGVLLTFVPLLFPDGRLPSPRWRPVAWLVAAAIGLAAAGSIATDEVIAIGLPNALRVDSVALRAAFPAGIAVLLGGCIAAIASQVMRYRNAGPLTRVQIRWFVYAAGLFSGLVIACLLVFGVTSEPSVVALISGAHSLFPLAIAIAVLRHRLYDIDVLIRRTLVYALTTGSIAFAFFGGIVLLQALLRPLTTGSELAVAGSTLASVALFQPLRSRIRRAVDRRFFRDRYDSVRTLDAFGIRLRDEVSLDAVRGDLLDAVDQTMQPASASVWLRGKMR
jgi:hypothetical protein